MSAGTSTRVVFGFAGLLTVAFIVLKLTGHIGWSWWWVLSPVWITAALVVLVMIAVALVLWWIH